MSTCDVGWRARHVEVARVLTREFLSRARAVVQQVANEHAGVVIVPNVAEDRAPPPVRRQPLQCSNSVVHAEVCYPASPRNLRAEFLDGDRGIATLGSINGSIGSFGSLGSLGSEQSATDEAPGIRVTKVDYASPLRWGGDEHYDPRYDGDIHLEGACTIDVITTPGAVTNRGQRIRFADDVVRILGGSKGWRINDTTPSLEPLVDALGDLIIDHDDPYIPLVTLKCDDLTMESVLMPASFPYQATALTPLSPIECAESEADGSARA